MRYAVTGVFFGCFFLVGVILMAVLLAESHVELGPNSYGIRYGGYNKKIYTKVETANKRHWLSVGDEFITFPSQAVTVNHADLECYSSDRVELELTLSFQYSIKQTALIEMLYQYGEFGALHSFIFVLTRDTIRDVCALYSYEDFYTSRGSIETALRDRVASDMAVFDGSITSGALQLQNVHLPLNLSAAIDAKEEALQSVVNAQNARQQVLIAADTDLKTAQEQANIKLIGARAEAASELIEAENKAAVILIQATQQAQVEFARLEERGKAFAYIASQLGVNGTSVLPALRYVVNTGGA